MKRLPLLLLLAAVVFVPWPIHAQVASITVRWTAPGDDGDVGTAASYDMRWSAVAPDTTNAVAFAAWFTTATSVPNMPAPALAGTPQSVVVAPVGGFAAGVTYYFVIRTRDEAGNVSLLSNVAHKPLADVTRPRTIFDLRCD